MRLQTVWAGGYVPPVGTPPQRKEDVIRQVVSNSAKQDDIIAYIAEHGPACSGDIARGLGARHGPIYAALKRMLKTNQVVREGMLWRLPRPDEPQHKSKAEILVEWLQQHPDSSDLEVAEGLGQPRHLVSKMMRRLAEKGVLIERQVWGIPRFSAREGV